MKETYKVSIIVPIYNVELYVNRCIDNLINQTYTNVEIILVDDGSTDNSKNICNMYAEKDERCRVFHIKNRGLSGARNFGLRQISGEFVMFIDADDWIDINCIELCISKINEYNNVECILFPYIREFKGLSKKVDILGTTAQFFSSKYIQRRLFGPLNNELKYPDSMDNLNTAWGKLYSSKFIKNMEFLSARQIGTAEDLCFNINIFNKLNIVYYLPYTYYHYNKINNNSIVHSYKKDLVFTRKNLHKYMYDFIHKNKLSAEYIEALNNRMILTILSLSRNIMNTNKSFIEKYTLLKSILDDPIYKSYFIKFNFNKLEFKWKVYYFFVRNKYILGTMLMTRLAELLKKYLR